MNPDYMIRLAKASGVGQQTNPDPEHNIGHLRRASPHTKKMLRAMAENPGKRFASQELADIGGVPHIRQRLWFVAERLGDTGGEGLAERIGDGRVQRETLGAFQGKTAECRGDACGMGHTGSESCERDAGGLHSPEGKSDCQGFEDGRLGYGHSDASVPSGMADTNCGQRKRIADGEGREPDREETGRQQSDGELTAGGEFRERPGPTNGLWRDVDWLFCRDGKWRPVEPGTFPLANGAAARVGRLRGYGNGIVAQVAETFISAAMEVLK